MMALRAFTSLQPFATIAILILVIQILFSLPDSVPRINPLLGSSMANKHKQEISSADCFRYPKKDDLSKKNPKN
jgi:hypothetical protein